MSLEADKSPGVDGTKLPPKELYGLSNRLMDRAILFLYFYLPEFAAKFPDLLGRNPTTEEILEGIGSFRFPFDRKGKQGKDESTLMVEYDKRPYERKLMLVEQFKNEGKSIIMSSRGFFGISDDNSGHIAYYETPEHGTNINYEDNLKAVGKIESYLSGFVNTVWLKIAKISIN